MNAKLWNFSFFLSFFLFPNKKETKARFIKIAGKVQKYQELKEGSLIGE